MELIKLGGVNQAGWSISSWVEYLKLGGDIKLGGEIKLGGDNKDGWG